MFIASTVALIYNKYINNRGGNMKAIDLVGKRFSRLVVLSRVTEGVRRVSWQCLCDCGNASIVTGDSLTQGKTGSCGCRKKETALENCKKYGIKPTHGMTATPTWNSWSSMIERCRGHGSGGRYLRNGTQVCKRWEKFENFVEDMGKRPNGMTLDRIDNSLGYSKDNCRWSTASQQQRNKTNTRRMVIDGTETTIMDFADKYKIKKSAAQYFFTVAKLVKSLGLRVEVI